MIEDPDDQELSWYALLGPDRNSCGMCAPEDREPLVTDRAVLALRRTPKRLYDYLEHLRQALQAHVSLVHGGDVFADRITWQSAAMARAAQSAQAEQERRLTLLDGIIPDAGQ